MPLVRFAVKNEYGLGVQELYEDGVQSEDPKAVLDGVAVAGLVGILRQLGDLAQFAAEVFHGLQEQVAATSSKSRKLVNRVQRIEASLPSLEKAILSQTDHLRFAYTPGTEWHACIRDERNYFVCDDLPHFIMDSYEECKEPPRLQLLDRFDSGGPGSCLKRYSDPTFFRRASSCSEESNSEKSRQERKARKIKKRRSWRRSEQFPKSASILNGSSRMQFSSTGQGQSSLSGSTFDMTFKSDLGDQSDSHGSKEGTDFIECVSHPSISTHPEVQKNKGLSSSVIKAKVNTNGSLHLDEHTAVDGGDEPCSHAVEATIPRSSSATWDEKLEIFEQNMDVSYEIEHIRQVPVTNSSLHEQELKLVIETGVNQANGFPEQGSSLKSKADEWFPNTSRDGNFMEPTGLNCGVNEVRGFLNTKADLQQEYLVPVRMKPSSQVVYLPESGKPPELTTNGYLINNPAFRSLGTGEVQYCPVADFDIAEKKLETIDSEDVSAVDAFTEGGSNVKAIEWNQKESETVTADHVSQEEAKSIEWSQQDLEAVSLDSQGDTFSEGRSNEKVIERNQLEWEMINAEHVDHEDTFAEGGSSVKLIKWNQRELETQDAEDVSQEDMLIEDTTRQVIEWNQLDEIDSGTENFVDALNTIESESESDFETEMKKEVQAAASKNEMGENAVNGQLRIASNLEPENRHLITSNDCKEGHIEDLESSSASASSANMLSPDYIQPSHDKSDSAGAQKVDVSTCLFQEQSMYTNQAATPSNVPHGLDFCAINPERRVQPPVCEIRSTATPPSANEVSPDHAQSSCNTSKSAVDQKPDVSTCLFDKLSVQTGETVTPIDFCANGPAVRVETALCEIAKSGPEAPLDERIISAPHVSQEISSGSSTAYPLAFWTNGTLLGLQPSKPTVFSMPNALDSVPTSKINEVGQCSLDAVQKLDDPESTLASPVNESELGDKLDNNDQDVGSFTHLPHQRLQKTHDTSVDQNNSNLSNNPLFLDLTTTIAMPLETKVPVNTNGKNESSEATGASEDRSSLLSLLSRGLLKNSLRRSRSLGSGESHKSNDPLKTNGFDNRCQDAVSHAALEANLKGRLSSPVNSPPPSPPLEHMKISFQPVDGFDTSRLKLQYPEGVDHYENTLDAFPSFQLVPESNTLQHDIGSDSDNDTFCRSHACMSDESHSHLSDSDSEQWDSGDSTESNNHSIYNGLRRISSVESASISPQCEEADQGNVHFRSASVTDAHSLSDPSFGLPILDAKNAISFQETKLHLNSGIDPSHPQEPTHEPPPLPPLQWWISRPLFDEVEGNQGRGSDSLSQPIVPKLSDSAIPHNQKAEMDTSKKVEEQKFGQEQTYQAEKERRMDDGGDFLHQIRTKSFNLKRTEPTRSTYTPIPATSNKITAILQKASAIRQAVGSDDGEDDSWSDT